MSEKIKRFYEKGLWTAAMVRQAVDKGLLTEEQYRQIVGPQAGDGGKEAGPDAGSGVAEPTFTASAQDMAGSAAAGTEAEADG